MKILKNAERIAFTKALDILEVSLKTINSIKIQLNLHLSDKYDLGKTHEKYLETLQEEKNVLKKHMVCI